MRRATGSGGIAGALLAAILLGAGAASAELPAIDTFLERGGFSRKDVDKAKAGEIIRGSMPPSHERELVATLAFLVRETPNELMGRALDGLLDSVDPKVISWKAVPSPALPAAFLSLELSPDAQKRAKRYGSVEIGTDLNLSEDEIAAFRKLGPKAAPAAVEDVIRTSLMARMTAYQKQGLKGLAPYVRKGGDLRDAGKDLRSALDVAKILKEHVPAAYKMFVEYPASRVPGSRERFAWSQIDAHGVPTLVLTHGLGIPDGDAWVVMQRQFYVSEGYNCEQAFATFVPVESGTAVFYVNRTSTDQVSGFGGGAKRSIGSKLLASQLEDLMSRVQK